MKNKRKYIDHNKEFGDSLRFLYIVFICIIVLALVSLIVHQYFDSNIENIVNMALDITIADIEMLKPEPLEWVLYTTGLILLPFVILPTHFILTNYTNFLNNKRIYNVTWLAVFMVAILALAYAGTQEWGVWYYKVFLEKSVFNIATVIPFFLLIIIGMLIYFDKLSITNASKRALFKGIDAIFNIVVIYYLLLSFSINIFDISASKWGWAHLDAIYYSVVQVANSDSVLYVDRFYNTYGLYPHILEPIFLLVGGVSVLKFSIIQALLVFTSFWIIYYVMSRLITNRIIVSTGFLSVIWAQYYYTRFADMYISRSMEYYFQYTPLRIIFPCLILLLAYKYIERRNNFIRLFGYIASALSLIWNLETGIIVSISWYLFISYINIGSNASVREDVIALFRELLIFIGIIFLTLLLFYMYIYIRYGAYIQLQGAVETLRVFALLGHGMLPMPLVGPWNILILIYILAFSHALINIKDKDNSIIFLLAIMGFGLFYYYLGRSANGNIHHVSWPGIILLILYANKLHKKFSKGLGLNHEKVFFIGIITVVFGSAISMIYYMPDGINKLIIDRNQILNLDKDTIVKSNVAFIKKHTKPLERVLILSGRQAVYHSETMTASSFDTGLIELFYKEDYDRLISLIQDSDIKIFFDKDPIAMTQNFVWKYNNNHLASVIKNRYKKIASSNNMDFFSKIK